MEPRDIILPDEFQELGAVNVQFDAPPIGQPVDIDVSNGNFGDSFGETWGT